MSIADRIHGAAIRTAFRVWYGWRPYGRHAAFLERSQWWSLPELEALQQRKLQALLRHAYQNVPFYRKRFDEAGLVPGGNVTLDQFTKLPVLTKTDIQTSLHDMVATNANRRTVIENHTGGSTGNPITFLQDRGFSHWAKADQLRNYRMAGYRLGMKWAFLWGSDYDAKAHVSSYGKLVDRVVYNTLWINTFDLSLDTVDRAADRLERWNPEILVAYVSSAVLLAQVFKHRPTPRLHLKAIQTSAEVLTSADRMFLHETFGCPVFDRYGCREVNNIAHECSAHEGLHVGVENNLIELLDDRGYPVPPGEIGRIVVTNLNNYAMPLIRYENGDLAMHTDCACSCGRGLPMIEGIVGRRTDIITSPGGKLLHGEFFTHLFYKVEYVRQFRIIQESTQGLIVQIVPTQGFEAETVFSSLRQSIWEHGDPDFEVQFELHDSLPPAASGKYRFTVSNVPVDLGRV